MLSQQHQVSQSVTWSQRAAKESNKSESERKRKAEVVYGSGYTIAGEVAVKVLVSLGEF